MKKNKMKSCSQLKASLCGFGVSLIVSSLLVAVLAIFIENEYIDIISVSVTSYIIVFLSIVIGAFVGGSMISENKWRIYIIVGFAYYLCSLCIALMCYEGIGVEGLYALLVVLISVVTPILATKSMKKQNKHSKRKWTTR